MGHTHLEDLISCLEYGTNIHISVTFLDNHGNFKTKLPTEMAIHAKPFCDFMKSTPEGFAKCFKCRNTALKKAIETKSMFGGLCFNGVYEYCYPVVEKGVVIAVIFIGNILPAPSSQLSKPMAQFSDTFQRDFSPGQCRQFGSIIENHIKLLIHEYSDQKTEFNPLVENIIHYIRESLYHDISVRQIANLFNYNEKYLGKLFKKHTGQTVKEYINGMRLNHAEELLKNTILCVTEIAAKSGFNNVTYFNRSFKRQFGVSPTEYRKQCKK